MHYLQTLNDKQLQAAQHTEGYLRVIAGAGSGKTKLLVSRYAYLVKEYGINSANILCVTFTNKAAAEMKRRIRALVGDEYDTSMICTYHGFCVRVLREDVEKIFYPKEFQIIDTTQQKAILGEIYQRYELKLDHGSFEKMVKLIGTYKARNRGYVEKMCNTDKCSIMDNITTQDDMIVEDYLQHQKQIFAMDFQDLMYFTLDVFRRCPEVLEKWQERLNYIQVDEFQDSSRVEMELIDMLSKKHRNLMIVGDPDQNIYEWRGSDVGLLVNFDKCHKGTETIFLSQNYRSTPQILRCANTLIENNELRLKKDLFTKSGDGAFVYHYHLKNEYAEADKIVELISDFRRYEGTSFSDFAVLYRSGFLSRMVEKKFTECGIPYEIFGSVKFYHRMEVQDVIAYLRLVAFDDDASFKRIVNKPRRRFGRVKMQVLQGLRRDKSLFETLKENVDAPVFKNSGAKEFVQMIDALRGDAKYTNVSQIVESICALSGYEKYIRELGDMERFENLIEFKRIATEYEQNLGESIGLSEFLNQIALQSEDEAEDSAEKVKLMTIHAAKGLEFPVVFVIGLSEGIFPSSKTIEERKQLGLEEERRLCYVAITRAREHLYLLDSEGFTQGGTQKLPSRFLREIGEENYVRIGSVSKDLLAQTEAFAASQEGAKQKTQTLKDVGDRVEHPAFGSGVILEKVRNSYRIRFDKLNSDRVISADFFDSKRTLPVVIPKAEEDAEPKSSESDELRKFMQDFEKTFNVKPDTPQSTDTTTQARGSNIKNVENDDYKIDDLYSVPELKSVPGGQPDNQPAHEPYYQPKQNPYFEPIQMEESPKLNLSDYDNLWNRDDVPKTGWQCCGVTDLGAPCGVCQMCGHQIIRYVHHMVHPEFGSLEVGCFCAGKLEGDVEKAKRRENDLKNFEARRQNFMTRKWKKSKNNNSYLKIKDHLIVLYYSQRNRNWKYSLDNAFSVEVFETKEEAKSAAFEALEKALATEK